MIRPAATIAPRESVFRSSVPTPGIPLRVPAQVHVMRRDDGGVSLFVGFQRPDEPFEGIVAEVQLPADVDVLEEVAAAIYRIAGELYTRTERRALAAGGT